jgi:hypothetical protein
MRRNNPVYARISNVKKAMKNGHHPFISESLHEYTTGNTATPINKGAIIDVNFFIVIRNECQY